MAATKSGKGKSRPQNELPGTPNLRFGRFLQLGGTRTHGMDLDHPVGPANGSFAQIRPPGAARGLPGPQKGLSRPKRALLGDPRSAIEVSY